jgi:LmbE family N-acetylglucosaminyl deacetylase
VVSFDSRKAGTPAAAWRKPVRRRATPLRLDEADALLVIAAHPDDETLGAGGLIAEFASRGLPVQVVVASDGAASGEPGIALRRSGELTAAVATLAPDAVVTELGLPDSGLRDTVDELREALAPLIASSSTRTLIAATWPGDGHGDHRVVGEVATELAAGRAVIGYPIWMWHWGDPRDGSLPWAECRVLDIDTAPKRRAIEQYPSQTEGPEPMLLADFLEHFEGSHEYFFEMTGTTA